MGKNNRQHRASKRRHRDRTTRMGYARSATAGPGDERDIVEMLVLDAAEAAEHGDQDDLEMAVAALLARAASNERGAAMTEMALTGRLVRALRSAWEGGWQPADIVRAARKRLDGAHAEVAAAVITAEAATSAAPGVSVPDWWAAQLGQLAEAPPPMWSDRQGLRMGWVAGRVAADQAHLGPEQQLSPGVAV